MKISSGLSRPRVARRAPHPARAVLSRLESQSKLRAKRAFLGIGRSLDAEEAFRRLSDQKEVQILEGDRGEWVDSLEDLMEVDSFIEGGQNHVLPEDQYQALRRLTKARLLTARGDELSALDAYRYLKAGQKVTAESLELRTFEDLVPVDAVTSQAAPPEPGRIEVKVEEDYILVGDAALEYKH